MCCLQKLCCCLDLMKGRLFLLFQQCNAKRGLASFLRCGGQNCPQYSRRRLTVSLCHGMIIVAIGVSALLKTKPGTRPHSQPGEWGSQAGWLALGAFPPPPRISPVLEALPGRTLQPWQQSRPPCQGWPSRGSSAPELQPLPVKSGVSPFQPTVHFAEDTLVHSEEEEEERPFPAGKQRLIRKDTPHYKKHFRIAQLPHPEAVVALLQGLSAEGGPQEAVEEEEEAPLLATEEAGWGEEEGDSPAVPPCVKVGTSAQGSSCPGQWSKREERRASGPPRTWP